MKNISIVILASAFFAAGFAESNISYNEKGLSNRVNELENEVKKLEESVLYLYEMISHMQNSIEDNTQPPESNSLEVEDFDSSLSEEEAYKAAYKSIIAKDYNKAVVLFEGFIKNFPSSDYASNSYYWLGEIFLHDNAYEKAVKSFEYVISNYPSSNKVPGAMLKRAMGLIQLEKITDAKNQLELVIQNYPNSTTASIAKQKITEIENMSNDKLINQ